MKYETKSWAWGFLFGAAFWIAVMTVLTCGACELRGRPALRAENAQVDAAVMLTTVCVETSPFGPEFHIRKWFGSGVIVGPRRVLTADHVAACPIAGMLQVTTSDGRERRIFVDREWPKTDVARLELAPGDSFGDFTPPRVGEPAGEICSRVAFPERTSHCGAFEAYREDHPDASVQFAAIVAKGNSGAGAYDSSGRLVGIVTSGQFLFDVPMGTGFASRMRSEYLR